MPRVAGAAGRAEPAIDVDLLVAGLGPGGCAAALAARAEGLRTLAVEARGPEAQRGQLILVRPGAQAALRRIGLPDVTEGRRTTTIRQVERRLRAALTAAVQADAGGASALAQPDADAASPTAFELCWHTPVVGLDVATDHVRVTLRDEATGQQRQVRARHLIDATGGRLESLGRPARQRAGPGHLVVTAEYAAPPWFDGIVGVRDPATREICMLFPTWGRQGVIAYFDSQPGRAVDATAMVQRFEALAHRLGLGAAKHPVLAVDVYQRVLARATDDRVVPIGDAIGNVDVLWGAGLSNAIEDGVDAACTLAAAQRETLTDAQRARTRTLGLRLFRRHQQTIRRGRIILALRPLLERLWPAATLHEVGREALAMPPLLWSAVRLVFGRRPDAA